MVSRKELFIICLVVALLLVPARMVAAVDSNRNNSPLVNVLGTVDKVNGESANGTWRVFRNNKPQHRFDMNIRLTVPTSRGNEKMQFGDPRGRFRFSYGTREGQWRLIIVGPLVETEGIERDKVYVFFWATEDSVSAVLLPDVEENERIYDDTWDEFQEGEHQWDKESQEEYIWEVIQDSDMGKYRIEFRGPTNRIKPTNPRR